MFNGGIRGKRATDNQGTVNPQNKFIQTKYPQPYISGYAVSGLDDTALDPAGGQTVLVNGTGFATGVSATLGGTQIGAVTLVSPTQISFTSPAKSAGSYSLVVYNSSGGAAILVPGLTYSSVPTFSTAAGSIGSVYETKAISTSVSATSDSALTYTLSSGSLPSGATLSSSGTITGTAPADSGSTTYTFAITATDAELQDVTRTFTLTVNTDVVTWVTPSSGATISLDGTAYSQALSATDAASYSVSYTANALPTGLSLSSGTISGTPTVEGSTTTLLTATAATTGRSATNTVTWVVALNDTYWKYNTTLLSANAAVQTNSFVSDNSINNALITVVGDTRASNFNPYQVGFYSVHFDGTGQDFRNSSFTGANFGTSNNFTIEMWVYWFTTAGGNETIFELSGTTRIIIGRSTSGVRIYNNNAEKGFSATVRPGMWNHIAMVRNSGTINIYLNGVSGTSYADTTNWTHTTFYTSKNSDGSEVSASFYLSNLRILNGTAAYTTTFTPSTTPLAVTPTTTLLLAYSNRFSDFGNQNITFTVDGTPKVITNNPFTTVYQAGTQYYSNYFDGTGDYLSFTGAGTTFNNDNASSMTIEFWVYATASLTGIAGFFGYGTTANGYSLTIDANRWVLKSAVSVDRNAFVTTITAGTTPIVGQWQHYAVVFNAGTGYFYLDGTLVSSGTLVTSTLSSSTFLIGAAYNTASYLTTGHISNFRVVKGSALYSGTTVGTKYFTPTTSPLTAISGTQLLTCQDSTFKDNSTNSFTITANGDTKPLAVSPFTSNSYSSTQITTYGSGYFDGSGDYLTLASSPSFAFGTGNFTIEGWAYMIGINGTANGIFQQGTSFPINATTNTVAFGTVSIGQVWQIYANGTNTNSTATWIQNNWYHFAVVRNSTTTTLYINGVAVITVTGDSTNYTGTYFGIGAIYNTGYTQNGYISDLRVVKGTAVYTSNFVPQFTSPLTNITNTQLLTLQSNGNHNNSGFIDKSGFSNIITRSGNATNGTFSPYGDNWSYYFGASNSLTMAANSALNLGANNFTFECWIHPTSLLTGSAFGSLIGNGVGNLDIMLVNESSTTMAIGLSNYGYSQLINASSCNIIVGQWYHIVVTKSSNNWRIFVNGVLKGYLASTAYSVNWSSGVISQATEFVGYISNMRISSGVLSAYSTSSTTNDASIFTPPTTPLTASSSTLLLSCQSSRFVDSSINNITFTVNGSPKVQNFSPFSAVTVTKYYSTYFNGSSDYLTVGGTTSFNLNSAGSYTVEAWIYATGGSGTRRVIASKDHYSGTTYPSFSWYIESTNIMHFNIGSGTGSGTGAQDIPGTATISLNTWYHVACTVSGSTYYMYVNGTQESTGSITGTVGVSTGAIIVGAAANGVYFNGYISNLRITKSAVYTSAFTPSTIPLTTTSQSVSSANVSLLTCQNNTLIDNSTNYYTITGIATVKVLPVSPFTPPAPGTPIAYSPTTFGGSMYFDGTGDKLTISNYPGLSFRANDFTIQCWFWTNTTTSGVDQVIMTNGWASYAPWLIRINSSNQAMLNMSLNGGSWYVSEQPLGTVTTGQWYHLAVSRSSGVLRAFLNGIQAYTTDLTTNSLYDGSQALTVGGRSDTSVPLNGYIADAQLINGVGIYSANFYPGSIPTTPNGTLGTTKYTSTLLLNGTSGGVIDASRNVDFETVGDSKVTQFSPYNGNYYSVQFAGSTTDLLSVPSATWSTFTGQFTLECWVRFNNSTYTGNLFGVQNNGALCLYYNVSSWNVNNYGSGDIINTGWNPTAGVWYHIAITRNSSNLMSFWVNGVQSGTATTSSTYTQNVYYLNNFGATSMNFNLCDFRVISGQCLFTGSFTPSTSPLTTTAVGHTGANVAASITGTVNVLLCQSNKFIDNSSNAYTVSSSGSPKVQSQNPFQVNSGISYYFDGTGDYLTSPNSPNNNPGAGSFTLEFWLYYNSITGYQTPYSKGYTAASELLFQTGNGNGTMLIYISGTAVITESSAATAGQWYHYALVRNGTALTLYRNGVSVGTATNSVDITNTYQLAIGAAGKAPGGGAVGDYAFNGYLSDFRLTKGYARYTTTFTPPTNPVKLN